MASSGVAVHNPSLSSIINDAYKRANIIRDDETPSGNAHATALSILNDVVKAWQAQNIRVWTLEEAVLFLQPNQYRYQLGLTATDEFTDAWDYLSTTTSAAAAAAATAVTVESVTGLAASDRVGIQLDDGTVQWTTVSSISTLTINLGAALTGAVSSGNKVFGYTSRIIRPLKISRAAAISFGDTVTETPVDVISRNEYMDMPNKTATGEPSAIHYGPKLPLGELFVWPAPVNANTGIRFTYQRPIFDFVSNSDTADFPAEWQMALKSSLAYHLAVRNQAPISRINNLKEIAEGSAMLVASWDRESESVIMQPDIED